MRKSLLIFVFHLLWLAWPAQIFAGAQREETLADNVASAMRRSVADHHPARLLFSSPKEGQRWLRSMSERLKRYLPDAYMRERLLISVHYEAKRAGLNPQMILGLIQVESGFRQYAISKVGARGLMQVMPFWVHNIGTEEHNLFDLRTNLRYGCTILRHYLDREDGNLFLALGRYNGSRGHAKYPNLVYAAWKDHWSWGHTSE